MWTVVYMAPDRSMANTVCTLLKANNILIKVREIKKNPEAEGCSFEILVPDAEVCESQELIFETEIN